MLWLLFILSFLASFFIAECVRHHAVLTYIKSQPQPVSTFKRVVSDYGGFSFILCWFVTIFLLRLSHPEFLPLRYALTMIPCLFLVLFVYFDSKYHFPSILHFLTYFSCIAFSLFLLGGLDSFDFGQYHIPLSSMTFFLRLLINIAVVFIFTLFIYAFKACKDMDAFLGCETILICIISIFFIPVNNVLFPLIPCIGGFLVLNWHPARVAMGNVGSTFLGFTIAVAGLYFFSVTYADQLETSSSEYYKLHLNLAKIGHTSLFLYLIISGVVLLDYLYTSVRRVINHENISEPSVNYLHQRLLLSGFSHTRILLVLLILNSAFTFLAAIAFLSENIIVSSLVVVLSFILFFLYAYWVERKYPFITNNSAQK